MGIESVVNVQVVLTQTGPTQESFDKILILSANAAWVERTRRYGSLSAVAADFATTTPEYKAATAIFSQSPRVKEIVIGRLANKPTMRWAVTPSVVANSTLYPVRVGANTTTFTSDGSALLAEITLGLTTAINLFSGDTLTASDQSTFVRLTGNSNTSWDDVEVMNTNVLKIEMDHVDPGVAADLDAILLETSDWYVIVNPYNSTAMATAIAVWTEANKKLFICGSQETEIATIAVGPATDIAKDLQVADYFRTAVMYHPSNGSFIDAAWAGALLPLSPGSETWNLKTLAGITPPTLTDNQQSNISAKNANSYRTLLGSGRTFDGHVASGEWVDVTRFVDWDAARTRERLFAVLAGLPKVPMTDLGLALLDAELSGQNEDGIEAGGISPSPAPTSFVPLLEDISDADRGNRVVNGMERAYQLAGAVHSMNVTVQVNQ